MAGSGCPHSHFVPRSPLPCRKCHLCTGSRFHQGLAPPRSCSTLCLPLSCGPGMGSPACLYLLYPDATANPVPTAPAPPWPLSGKVGRTGGGEQVGGGSTLWLAPASGYRLCPCINVALTADKSPGPLAGPYVATTRGTSPPHKERGEGFHCGQWEAGHREVRTLGYVRVGVWTQPGPKLRPAMVGYAALLPETLGPLAVHWASLGVSCWLCLHPARPLR